MMYADQLDQASELEDRERVAGIERSRKAESLPAIGICYYCKDGLPANMRFCNADCRDDYEIEQELRRRIGR